LGPRFLPRPTTAGEEGREQRWGGGEPMVAAHKHTLRVARARWAFAPTGSSCHSCRGSPKLRPLSGCLPASPLQRAAARPRPAALTNVHEAAVVLQALAGPAGGLLGLVLLGHLGALPAHLAGASQRAVDLACRRRGATGRRSALGQGMRGVKKEPHPRWCSSRPRRPRRGRPRRRGGHRSGSICGPIEAATPPLRAPATGRAALTRLPSKKIEPTGDAGAGAARHNLLDCPPGCRPPAAPHRPRAHP
jgi:hypothetical protein